MTIRQDVEIASVGQGANPAFFEALKDWLRIGILSFGGPSAQIALMHKVIVEERGWLSEQRFLNALSFCMLLPGPEAMQLATYCGWRLHGVRGGLAAGLSFVLPGALVIMILASIYVLFGQVPFIEAMFLGVKATVVIIVIEALLRISKKALKRPDHWVVAGLAFVAIFFLDLPFPLLIVAGAIYGFFRFASGGNEEKVELEVSPAQSLKTASVWLAIWLVPLLTLQYALPNSILSELGWFFSELAVVTFGGAYAVLAYMGQEVVNQHQWLEAGQMMDGLGLAETTPGPLILVTQFVGFLASYFEAQNHSILFAIAGASVALWATFIPCFAWIFTGAPYIEWITNQPRLKGALAAITAVVVGVVLNLAIWFALHVFFGEVSRVEAGMLTLWTPTLASIDLTVVIVAFVSGYLLLVRHWSMIGVLAIAAVLALALGWAMPA